MAKSGITSLLALSFTLLSATVGVTGCTVYGVKNPPTLKSTSSAEQHERIFWAKARDARWQEVAGLLGGNVVYVASGKVLTRDQVVPYLQAENIREVSITDLVIKANGPDMAISYHLDLSLKDGTMRPLAAMSVWQQARSGWILIAHSEHPA